MKRLLRMSYLVAGVAGLGFFVMSVLLLAFGPAACSSSRSAARRPIIRWR